MSIYFTGKIYAIKCNETDDVYIGSTVKTLNTRFANHKSDMKHYVSGNPGYITSYEIIKYKSAYIELLETYPCNSKMELEQKEGEYIRKMECVNKNVVGRTDEEKKEIKLQQKKEHYERNKEHYKEYRSNNKERMQQYNKEYQENNKERIKEHRYNKKERTQQYNKEYYEATKEKYTCICGSGVAKHNRRRHERTAKHKNYIAEIDTNGDTTNLNEFFEQFKFRVSI